MKAASSADVGHKRLILGAVVIVAILAVVILALLYFAPGLINDIGGTFGTTLSALSEVPTGAEVAPTSPLENIEEKANPFDVTNPFAYKSPFE